MLLFNQRDEPNAEFAREMERLAALVADMESIRRGVPPQVMACDDAPVLDRWVLAKRGRALPRRTVDRPSDARR